MSLVLFLLANYFFPWDALPFSARSIGILLAAFNSSLLMVLVLSVFCCTLPVTLLTIKNNDLHYEKNNEILQIIMACPRCAISSKVQATSGWDPNLPSAPPDRQAPRAEEDRDGAPSLRCKEFGRALSCSGSHQRPSSKRSGQTIRQAHGEYCWMRALLRGAGRDCSGLESARMLASSVER